MALVLFSSMVCNRNDLVRLTMLIIRLVETRKSGAYRGILENLYNSSVFDLENSIRLQQEGHLEF